MSIINIYMIKKKNIYTFHNIRYKFQDRKKAGAQ